MDVGRKSSLPLRRVDGAVCGRAGGVERRPRVILKLESEIAWKTKERNCEEVGVMAEVSQTKLCTDEYLLKWFKCQGNVSGFASENRLNCTSKKGIDFQSNGFSCNLKLCYNHVCN